MAKTLNTKAAGLDLVDRLYRNQLLVDLAFSEDERDCLVEIAKLARGLLLKEGYSDLELERAVHCVLTCIESQVADNLIDHVDRYGLDIPLPEDLDRETYDRAESFSRDYATASFLAYGTMGSEDTSGIVRVVNALAQICADLPALLRHRLAERVFAAEFPLASLEILTWLARNDILVPAKYRGTSGLQHSLGPVSIRAVSLWQQDNIRLVIQSSMPGHDSTVIHRTISQGFAKHLSEAGMIWIAEVLRTETKRARSRSAKRVPYIDPGQWEDSNYLQSTLKNLRTFAPWSRAELCAQSTVVSDIGASLLARAKLMNSTRGLIRGDELKPTLSDEISLVVNQHGFQMSARTMYNRLKEYEVRADRIIRCCSVMREAGMTYPVEYPDFYRMFQIAMTA
ncbi:hypothetical protein [Stenotrophomonas maltophilia]|uniref:hypothetical protein n=1 Tax=Stenotrophomonas maltophilia TaxID=40324 RepID=UPI002E7A71E4|nr:hypothetical protein [Stenotrophomonas maltophilia]